VEDTFRTRPRDTGIFAEGYIDFDIVALVTWSGSSDLSAASDFALLMRPQACFSNPFCTSITR
jgi:hypothetical protein